MSEDYSIHQETGLIYRADSTDLDFIRSVPREYGHLRVLNQVVMDCGACFGAFSHWAYTNGARRVVAYEPLPLNYGLLSENMGRMVKRPGSDVYVKHAALVHDSSTVTNLYVTSGRSYGNSSLVGLRGRAPVEVPATNFHEELSTWRPSVLKVDVEGAEYDLLSSPLPNHVTQLVMELHFTRNHWRDLARVLHGRLTHDEGFTVVTEPKIGEKNWNTIGAYER